MTLPTTYAWYPGWNAPDGSLVTVYNDLAPYCTPYMGISIEPKSGLVNTFPIRSLTLDGASRGDGMIPVGWQMGMPIQAWVHIISAYFSGGTVTSVKMTIVTARYELATPFVKANVWMNLPIQTVDYNYDSQYIPSVNLGFTDYIQL